MDKDFKKICITGGHITPALAVVDAIKQKHKNWELVLIGRNERERVLAQEYAVRFFLTSASRLSSFLGVVRGFFQAFSFCKKEQPDIIVSFGGYVSLPFCIAGWLFGIPIIIHEQTRIPGTANRIIAMFARTVCVTFEETLRNFPTYKTVFTGLPLRQQIRSPQKHSPFSILENLPLLYITGGSTGAVSMNELVFPILNSLLKNYTVVHQTGIQSLPRAKEFTNKQYIARDFFDVQSVSWLFAHARVVVARAGANTVIELALAKKQAILVPLPWSARGEQQENARWLKSLGLAKIVDQDHVSSDELLSIIDELMESKIPQNTIDVSIPTDGADRMVQEIDGILS